MGKILKLIFKNALRHKLRAALTILGIAIAVVAFGLMRTVVTAWNSGVANSAANRLITRQAVSFIFTLPYAHKEKIMRVPGVEQASGFNWFGGVFRNKSEFFARMSCDPETIFDVYPEFILPQDQKETFKKQRNSCIIGIELAKRYQLKIGDAMDLEGDIYPGKWQFIIRGIYTPRDKVTDATQMFFHWNYLNERMKVEDPDRAGEIGWYVVKIANPDNSAVISKNIDAVFSNSRAETKTETERAFQQGFVQSSSAILTAVDIVSYVIIGIIMLVLGNTMIMSARERTREYAVLKTLGFSGAHLVSFIAGESLILSIMGSVVGIVMLTPLVGMFEQNMPKGFFPVFYIEPATLVFAAAAALAVGIAASIIPIRKALTTRIVDGLRFVG